MKDDDEPAFPTDYHFQCPECKTEGWQANAHGGMTLRDYLAAKMAAAFISNATLCSIGNDYERYAEFGYAVADAMLKARNPKSIQSGDEKK